ncbi:MAG: GNAT family N-acetyltransferase [Bacteroidetes bacterium]|nr:GNAT family N-acetyltransferase [Bacteroidota bacterium]
MLKLIRTDSSDTDFHSLVRELDADLQVRDGADHAFFAQFNKIDKIQHVVVAYSDNLPVGCGAVKEFQEGVMEVKRMYVKPEFRGKGIASEVLKNLEVWAAGMKYRRCVLETGEKQPEAIALYKRNGYQLIPNYGQYADVATSVCFEKLLF